MVSQPKGLMYVPVWIDDGVVKALVLDSGALPVTETTPLTALDITLKASDITLPVAEQTPLTYIQARLLTYYGASWQAAAIEADGSLHVHLKSQEADVGIAQATPALLQPGINSYVGGGWQKQPLIWGYSDRILEQVNVNPAPAGQNNVYIGGVPAGEVWVIESMALIDFTSACTAVRFGAYDGSSWMWFDEVLNPGAAVYSFWTGSFRVKQGDSVGGVFMGVTLNDNILLNISGYKMDVDL